MGVPTAVDSISAVIEESVEIAALAVDFSMRLAVASMTIAVAGEMKLQPVETHRIADRAHPLGMHHDDKLDRDR